VVTFVVVVFFVVTAVSVLVVFLVWVVVFFSVTVVAGAVVVCLVVVTAVVVVVAVVSEVSVFSSEISLVSEVFTVVSELSVTIISGIGAAVAAVYDVSSIILLKSPLLMVSAAGVFSRQEQKRIREEIKNDISLKDFFFIISVLSCLCRRIRLRLRKVIHINYSTKSLSSQYFTAI